MDTYKKYILKVILILNWYLLLRHSKIRHGQDCCGGIFNTWFNRFLTQNTFKINTTSSQLREVKPRPCCKSHTASKVRFPGKKKGGTLHLLDSHLTVMCYDWFRCRCKRRQRNGSNAFFTKNGTSKLPPRYCKMPCFCWPCLTNMFYSHLSVPNHEH